MSFLTKKICGKNMSTSHSFFFHAHYCHFLKFFKRLVISFTKNGCKNEPRNEQFVDKTKTISQIFITMTEVND